MEATKNATATEAEVTQKPRKDVYTIVTERIIEKLQQGTVPWRQPWIDAGIPKNVISDRPYRGINIMLLAMLGFEQNLFLTFKQVREIGGTVKRGEKAHLVVYWNYVERQSKEPQASTGEAHKTKKAPMLRYYTVFNVSQCEGIPEKYLTKAVNEWSPLETCDQIIDDMPHKPKIISKEQRAYYDPLKDLVNMPKATAFEKPEAYYSTFFHELIHSTGHSSRLDRKDLLKMAEFGSEPYSHEELVAEIGTCYLQSFAGITSEFEQSASYIASWLKVFQNDVRFIFSASTQAQKATDFILNAKDEVEDAEQKTE